MVLNLTAALVVPEAGLMAPDRGLGTVLVVDDTEVVLRVIAAMLKRIGYLAIAVNTVTEAFRVLGGPDDIPIDLILLDSGADEGSALDTVHEIHRLRPALPIVFMTGFPEQRRVFKRRGAPVLQKPFTSVRLKIAIREALQKPRASSAGAV